MASRFDVLKSLVRSAARAGAERVQDLGAVRGAKAVLAELRQRRVTITEPMMSSAIAQTPGVSASSVSLANGRIALDATFEDGRSLAMTVLPQEVRFAPRGAKEILFTVEPPEIVGDGRARDVVGCVAAAIARGVWGPMLGPRTDGEAALVEREGARLRCDLRTVPAVRASLEGSPFAMALDVLTIGGFEIEDRALRVTLGLPAGVMP